MTSVRAAGATTGSAGVSVEAGSISPFAFVAVTVSGASGPTEPGTSIVNPFVSLDRD